MENVKIEELIKEIKENHREDYTKIDIDCLCDYDDGCYICDAIAEISDYRIDIYYKDLFDWAKDNFSDIEEANKEYGDVNPDITKQIQQAQYYVNTNYCYDNINDMLKIYCYNLLKENEIKEISESQQEKLEEYIQELDSDEYLPSFDDLKEELEESED